LVAAQPPALGYSGDQSPVAAFVLTPQGTIVSCGGAAQRLLGYATEDVVGRPLTALAREADRVRHALERLGTSRSIRSVCLTLRTLSKAHREIPSHVCIDAMKDRQGRLEAFLVSVRDLRTVVEERPEGPKPARQDIPQGAGLERLSPRQRQVLELIARGYSTREIAERLGRSVKTVETHRAELMKRLNIHHVPGLVGLAIRSGLVAID
jgi:PAS domain S-box-containing protein